MEMKRKHLFFDPIFGKVMGFSEIFLAKKSWIRSKFQKKKKKGFQI